MNRVFTTREKILLVILAILLIGCFYYLVVLKPSLDTLASSESQLSAVQDEIGGHAHNIYMFPCCKSFCQEDA